MDKLLRQSNQPLFPEIAWETPQTKTAAKKLLILSGQASQVKVAEKTYRAALAAGIGQARIVLPDKLRSLLGKLDHVLYVPSTNSGTISKSAHEELEGFISESDGILLGESLGKHPDTSVLIEQVLTETTKPVIMNQEVIDLLSHKPTLLQTHHNRVLVASPQYYVKLANLLKLPVEIMRQENLLNKVGLAESINETLNLTLVMTGSDTIVSSQGRVSHTVSDKMVDASEIAAWVGVYYLQHQDKFKAVTAAIYDLTK